MRAEKLWSSQVEENRLNFDMLINDFGPIKKAAISLRPLTIFIGGNNLGKSYAAMLAHSVISAGRGFNRRSPFTKFLSKRTNILDELEKTMIALKSTDTVKCPPRLAAKITRSCVDEYRAHLQHEIMRNFGSKLPDLTRFGADHFSMTLKAKKRTIMSYKKSRLTLNSIPKFDIIFSSSKAVDLSDMFQLDWNDDGKLYCTVDNSIVDLFDARRFLVRLYMELRSAIAQRAVATLPAHSRYFPAARSGILQAHRVITSNVVRNAPYAGIEDIHVPRLSGVVSDFVSTIIDMHPIRGTHNDTGNQIENDIFSGHVELKYTDPGALPEIFYERSGITIPIHRTSSTISELAPFTLHLKHSVGGRGVLIIEEPEAHLHPSNQNLLAGHIVKLVREGANIIITTHSSTLFESVSQYLRASQLQPKGRKNAFGREDLYLTEDEIAPHLFRMDGDEGSTVERIPLSAKDGMKQDEFVKEDRLLNEINLRIEEHGS